MSTNEQHRLSPAPHDGRSDDSMFGMMAMMMAMCAGVILLIVFAMPALGYPLGPIVVFGAVALMFILHARFMDHGAGHEEQ